MSSTIGGRLAAGTAIAIGLVDSSMLGAAPGRQVVGVADRDVEADHVARERHARVQRRRARRGCCDGRRPRRRPPSARLRRSRARRRGCITRWPMPLSPSTSAMPARSRSTRMSRPQVDAARLDPPDVVRQAEDAVAVGPERVRLGHQRRDGARIRAGHPHGVERALDEAGKPLDRHPSRLALLAHRLSPGCGRCPPPAPRPRPARPAFVRPCPRLYRGVPSGQGIDQGG